MASTQASNIQELLDHADWLRRLATRLVFPDREDMAADAVQQTWLAALRSPRQPGSPPRPWLATVLRNVVIKAGRTVGRRRANEATATKDAPAEAPSPEQLLESMELQRLLTGMVEGLAEPYRTTVLLRYYEGIEPSEIARRLDLPAGTVRWRLSEGLAQLRRTLAEKYAHGGVEWQRALLPLVLPRSDLPLARISAAAGAGGKLSLTVGVVAIALVGTGLQWARRHDRGNRGSALATRDSQVPISEAAGSRREPTSTSPLAAGIVAPATRPGWLPSRAHPPVFTSSPDPATSDDDDGRPSLPAARVMGIMRKEDLQSAVRLALPAIKTCYESYLNDHPGKSGRLVVSMKLINKDGAGHLSHATIKPPPDEMPGAELFPPATELCVLTALAATPFPAPTEGEVDIEYPFQFDAE